jgi:hypothetical protein
VNPSPAFIVFSVCMLTIAACLMAWIIHSLVQHTGNYGEANPHQTGPFGRTGLWFALALLFGLLVAGYYVLRYHGLWTENDTATINQAIESMRHQRILLPTYLYQHGFQYQAISLTLLYFTNLTTQVLQLQVYPVLAIAGFILTSFVFFREVLKDPRAAAMASMMLIFQPDILFVTLRGSHEKITWPLMMLALAILYRSLGKSLKRMVIYVLLFYMVVFAIDTTNVFFGSVFLVAVALSMVLGFVLFRFWRGAQPPLPRQDIQRLMYISLSGSILIYIFIMYTYPPALANLRMLRSILEQVSALLLSFEVKAQPYGYIATGWINSGVYLMLTVFTWMVIGTSFLVWLRHGWRLIKRKAVPGLSENLDWLLYAGFAIQIAVSIAVDLSGALSANLQLRLFPSFTVVAIVLLVRFLKEELASVRLRPRLKMIAVISSGLLSAWFTLASVLKATNDPALSNKWCFFFPSELEAVAWIDGHLRSAVLWTGIDERLATIFVANFRYISQSENTYRFGRIQPNMKYVLASTTDRQRAGRLGVTLLPVAYWDQIFDDGYSQIYHIPLYIVESREP